MRMGLANWLGWSLLGTRGVQMPGFILRCHTMRTGLLPGWLLKYWNILWFTYNCLSKTLLCYMKGGQANMQMQNWKTLYSLSIGKYLQSSVTYLTCTQSNKLLVKQREEYIQPNIWMGVKEQKGCPIIECVIFSKQHFLDPIRWNMNNNQNSGTPHTWMMQFELHTRNLYGNLGRRFFGMQPYPPIPLGMMQF